MLHAVLLMTSVTNKHLDTKSVQYLNEMGIHGQHALTSPSPCPFVAREPPMAVSSSLHHRFAVVPYSPRLWP